MGSNATQKQKQWIVKWLGIREWAADVNLESLLNISDHYKELRQKYGSKFFAIKDQDVLFAEEEMEKLLDILEEKGIDINQVFVTSISPKGVASIL